MKSSRAKEYLFRFFMLAACVVAVSMDHSSPRDSNPYQVKSFIGAIIGGVTSLAGGILGASAANRRRRQVTRMIDKRERALDAWRQAETESSFLDRADSQAALRRVAQYNEQAQKAGNTDAVRRGMTDEARVASAERMNRGYADTVSQIAAAGQRHKDLVQQQYMSEKNNLENMKIRNMSDTSGASALAQGIASAGGAIGTALTGMENLKTTAENAAAGVPNRAETYAAENLPALPDYYQIKLEER